MTTVTGQPYDAFNDLMLSTPQYFASGQDEFAIYMQEGTWLLNCMMENQALDRRFFGGVEVTDRFVDNFTTTGQYRRPNGETKYSMPQYFKQWKSHPALFLDYISWTQFEFIANGITKDLQGGVIRQKLKDLRNEKFTMQKVQQARQFENDLLAKPSYKDMEGPEASIPRSIFCYYNEGLPASFATLQGIDQTVVTQFSCERVEANFNTNIDTNAWEGFLGMDILLNNTQRQRIPFANRPQGTRGTPRQEILASSWGYVLFQSQLRASNDILRYEMHDAGVMYPKHGGIGFRRLTSLDGREVWDSGGGAYDGTEQTATVEGPRYILMDYEGFEPRFHKDMHFYQHPVMEHPQVVGTKVMPIETWWMTLSVDPRTGGVLSPTVNVPIPAGLA